uniref:t-SNARE coiled-coil homology domain-containing protein n=1 Tax=Mesocestoides corti TaxID=53468 RepID=A0A5K3FUZ6_MESCO
MDLQETLHEISSYIKVLDEVTNELEQKKAQIVSLRTGCLVARSTGAAVGTVGMVISVIGF